MSRRYPAIAFTDDVQAVQHERGSDTFYERKRIAGAASTEPDALTDDEIEFLADRDGFYLATVSEPVGPTCSTGAAHPVSCVYWMSTPSAGPISAAICSTSAPAISAGTIASLSSLSTMRVVGGSRSSGMPGSPPPTMIQTSSDR